MPAEPHCPGCRAPLEAPRERLMPDGIMEYRCPSCSQQIPLIPPGGRPEGPCPGCGVADPATSLKQVDTSGMLNFLLCGSCGRVHGRYWGVLEP